MDWSRAVATEMNCITSRRRFLSGLVAGCIFPAPMVIAQTASVESDVRQNISAFRTHRWQDHFETLENGVILLDTTSRMLQYWSEDGSFSKIYPTSVPLTEDLTRLGYTRIIRKVDGPSWRPTHSMKERNPEWPDFIGPGPQNPLGTHALYLSWQYYRIHGTNDTRKIGRRSSNGCIGLYNEQIQDLFALAKVGTQVKLI